MLKLFSNKTMAAHLLTSMEAEKILQAARDNLGSLEISTDLGLSQSTVYLEEQTVRFDSDLSLPLKDLQTVVKQKKIIFCLAAAGLSRVCFFKGHFYKLVPTGGYPTLEIDGIQMHRTKDISPEVDAQMKIELVNILPGNRVLEIGTGLGYTAIKALKRGAKVTTIEKNPEVLEIARLNPYSAKLFEGQIEIIIGDGFEEVKKLNKGDFDVIIHDPPRFGMAEHLYSSRFYEQLFRILKPKGKIFHYIGSPGAKYRGKKIAKGVMKRLTEVGFKVTEAKEALGVIGIKQRVTGCK